jgi:hypothetical protein
MTTKDRSWMRQGRCVEINADPNVFQPHKPAGHTTPEYDRAVARALAICAVCNVRTRCLEFALANGETGIWGMTTTDQRDRMRKANRLNQEASR